MSARAWARCFGVGSPFTLAASLLVLGIVFQAVGWGRMEPVPEERVEAAAVCGPWLPPRAAGSRSGARDARQNGGPT